MTDRLSPVASPRPALVTGENKAFVMVGCRPFFVGLPHDSYNCLQTSPLLLLHPANDYDWIRKTRWVMNMVWHWQVTDTRN